MFIMSVVLAPVLEVDWTTKNQTLNISNFRGSNFKHIQTSHFSPKTELWTSQTSQKAELFPNISNKKWLKIFQIFKTELWTYPNLSFWPKTKHLTSRTLPKTKQFANIELFYPPLFRTSTITPTSILWVFQCANHSFCYFGSNIFRTKWLLEHFFTFL